MVIQCVRNTYNLPIIPTERVSIIYIELSVYLVQLITIFTIKERMTNVVIMMGKCIESNKNATKNIYFIFVKKITKKEIKRTLGKCYVMRYI